MKPTTKALIDMAKKRKAMWDPSFRKQNAELLRRARTIFGPLFSHAHSRTILKDMMILNGKTNTELAC